MISCESVIFLHTYVGLAEVVVEEDVLTPQVVLHVAGSPPHLLQKQQIPTG